VCNVPPYSLSRYLEAKISVDDRALNRRVWRYFLDSLPNRLSLRLLDVGGGTGATVPRVVSAVRSEGWRSVDYTLVDKNSEALDTAASSLRDYAESNGFTVTGRSPQHWSSEDLSVTLRLVAEDLFAFAGRYEGASFDAVIGQALFDLLNIPDALQQLRPLLRKKGLWYLPIHFDGVTSFEPPLNPDLDAKIETLYHESMSDEEGGGQRTGAQSGRRLLTELRAAGESLLAAGGSDWVVFPREDGYPDEEAYFLYQILHFVETELADHPDLSRDDLEEWLRRRRRQIEEGRLIYIAHQLDVLAQSP